MDISPGDVIEAFSPTASKRKYHLCVVGFNDHKVAQFLFVNSEYRYESDLCLDDGEIENLPKSRTGITVISFSDIVRFRHDQLKKFQAKRRCTITAILAVKICEHTKNVPTLRNMEKNEILAAISLLIDKNA